MHIRLLKPLETKKEEENHRKGGEVTAPHLIYEKTMTSLSLSRQKSEGKDQQDSAYIDRRNSEADRIIPIYQYKTSVSSLKPSESGKEQKESKFKLPGSTNRQNVHDVIDDSINREGPPTAKMFMTSLMTVLTETKGEGELSTDPLPESAMLHQIIRSRM